MIKKMEHLTYFTWVSMLDICLTTETLLTSSLFILANHPIIKTTPTRINGVNNVDKMKVLLVILFKYSLEVIIINFSIFSRF